MSLSITLTCLPFLKRENFSLHSSLGHRAKKGFCMIWSAQDLHRRCPQLGCTGSRSSCSQYVHWRSFSNPGSSNNKWPDMIAWEVFYSTELCDLGAPTKWSNFAVFRGIYSGSLSSRPTPGIWSDQPMGGAMDNTSTGVLRIVLSLLI